MSTSGAEKLFALQGGEQREANNLGVSLAQLSSPALGPESSSYVKLLKCNHLSSVPFQTASSPPPQVFQLK